jgi:acyl-CoA dehydrogenase
MHLLEQVAEPRQKEEWLRPLAAGKIRSCFMMTEPAPGAGADPSMLQTTARREGDEFMIDGRKWLITGAVGASLGIVMARNESDALGAAGATMFLTPMNAPGIHIERVLNTLDQYMTGGHAVVRLDGLRVHEGQVLGRIGEGFRYAQVRLAPARLTHCMRWLGQSKRCLEIAQDYVNNREGFGIRLADRESVQIKLGQMAHQIQIGRLLTMHAAWKLDRGDRARKEVSMAKVHVADTLHQACDTAIQLNGARGYSKDTILEWIYRAARAARLVDGASEVHNMVLARFLREEGRDFWTWSAGNKI